MLYEHYNYFNFKEMEDGTYLVSNDYGGWKLLTEEAFKALLLGKIEPNTNLYYELKNAFFIVDETNKQKMVDALKKMKPFAFSTKENALLILKLTNYCNYNCVYCQASSEIGQKECFMTFETAKRAIDMIIDQGVRTLTIEFQGGEPLANFDVLKQVVLYVNETYSEHMVTQFRAMSNLSLLTDEIHEFCLEHNIDLGTSIDGPEELHNACRTFKNGTGTYAVTLDKYIKLRDKNKCAGFITTVPKSSLAHYKELVDFRMDMQASFYVRPLFKLGRAYEIWDEIGYTAEEFIEFYNNVVTYMIEKCMADPENPTIEARTTELASRLVHKTSFDVEILSPCGSIASMVSVDWNGDVMACEGSKMIKGKRTRSLFKLGNVYDDSFEVFYNRKTMGLLKEQNSACDPHCYRCVYAPFCGNCNVERKVSDTEHLFNCKINEGMFDTIIRLIRTDENFLSILVKWFVMTWETRSLGPFTDEEWTDEDWHGEKFKKLSSMYTGMIKHMFEVVGVD